MNFVRTGINNKEAFVSTLRAARNMAFQGTITPHIEQLAEIDGSKIVGIKIHAPFAIDPQVYVLPMNKGKLLPTVSYPLFSI